MAFEQSLLFFQGFPKNRVFAKYANLAVFCMECFLFTIITGTFHECLELFSHILVQLLKAHLLVKKNIFQNTGKFSKNLWKGTGFSETL